ncbi:glyoxylate/hydroxypyruvate reductase A [Roseibaca sp. V10]|uniref:Glyoxylate/hydroxypyruvate reductase A n=1 Tax=Roseinatronobacter domitianus TaxID=2940293 RepID=A0ABT0LYU3_9RHOB|nr:glyoxylate/hydroxypyruvate reductase A [Roseibaca domitiana]MCL1627355.1 glyoxylate/hydroxypyruvate reductase A [Roseibaca domitiana]
MTLTVLLAAGDGVFEDYDAPLRAAIAKQGLDAQLVTDAPAQTVDYIVYAPSSPLQDFTPFTNCRAVLSLWAGVERIVGNATLTQPLARMVDPSLTQGMVEYVVGHVLRYHLALDKPATSWTPVVPPLAQDRCVGFLGLGELGRACAGALRALGFDVAGWSRSPRQLEGIACHSGPEGLRAVLARSDILVTLLPDTPATTNILNATTLAHLPRGARIINPGRGTAIDDAALLAALDQGQIAAATLDVFRTEPLPENHPFWHHPNVTVTPHIAAATRTETASDVIAANIARVERGQPLLHEVSRHNGY